MVAINKCMIFSRRKVCAVDARVMGPGNTEIGVARRKGLGAVMWRTRIYRTLPLQCRAP